MKILISGASGSFGSELTSRLNNFELIRIRHGKMDKRQMSKLLNCSTFIHCGALLQGNFSNMLASNALLTKDILDFLSLKNPKAHFIYFSSMSILKKRCNVLPDDHCGFRDMTDYALSKHISECICSRYKIPITIVRFSTLFYKDPKKDGLSKLIYDAVKNRRIILFDAGKAKRDFLPLDIAARYAIKIVNEKEFYGKTLNIVSGKENSFKDVADFLKTKINKLIIKNIKQNLVDNVATNFDCGSIRSLGEIRFDLFEKINDYIQEL